MTKNRVREPDVIFVLNENASVEHNRAWEGADLAVEVVSGGSDDRKRDYEDKLADYAALGVREYWIVDHQERRVLVYRLEGGNYVEHARSTDGEVAASALLDGFTIDVSALFKVADDVPQ